MGVVLWTSVIELLLAELPAAHDAGTAFTHRSFFGCCVTSIKVKFDVE